MRLWIKSNCNDEIKFEDDLNQEQIDMIISLDKELTSEEEPIYSLYNILCEKGLSPIVKSFAPDHIFNDIKFDKIFDLRNK